MMTDINLHGPNGAFPVAAQPQQQTGSQPPVRQQQGGVQYTPRVQSLGGDTFIPVGASLDGVFPPSQRQP